MKQPPGQAGHQKGQTQDRIAPEVELLKRDQCSPSAFSANAPSARGLWLLFQKPGMP
jgi:hypothetical protein